MAANLIDGKLLASEIRNEIKQKIEALGKNKPCLSIILVGNHPASEIYVRNKQKACEEVGIKFVLNHFSQEVSLQTVILKIKKLNEDPNIHGILIQMPLPSHFNQFDIINSISPAKDVDGFHVMNVGKFTLGMESFVPCTALGCLKLIQSVEKDLSGKKALIIGRSNIVGRPTGQLLLRENCTITFAHSKTINLKEECIRSDIIISAIGKASFIPGSWLRPGQIIIDVGINRIISDGVASITGDVDFIQAKNIVKAITPVPGGVGPMTIAFLLQNTLKAFENIAL